MNPLLNNPDETWFSTKQLFLSYLAVKNDGASWASRLLDEVNKDFPEGLFLACFKLKSKDLDKKHLTKFVKWGKEKNWAPESTEELYVLGRFIAKWLGLYPYTDLEEVIRMYFKHVAQNEVQSDDPPTLD